MHEFMIFIKTKGDHLAGLSAEEQQSHVQKIGNYIGGLMESKKMIGAQPLEMSGAYINKTDGGFKDGPFNESKEMIVGYFHIRADSLNEAVQIAKSNPMFDDVNGSIEVRQIKQMAGIN